MAESRLRLMHVVFSLETGGLENGVINLCNRLDPDRFLPTICVFRGGGALGARLDPRRVEFLEVKRHLRYDPTLPFRLAYHLRHRRIDILHTHSWGTLVEGITAAALARTPIIIHGEHGVMEERPRNIPIQRFLWSISHQIAAVAGPLADRMASVVGVPRERIRVIPNGVDTDRFRPLKEGQGPGRQEFGLPSTGFVIGMVARLVPVKNHLGMLHALAQMKSNGVHAILALAGDGPLQAELQRVACGLGLAKQVCFLGDIVYVEKFLNALDVFVLNSYSEGMSNTILEAMACGLPVIATQVGANSMQVVHGESGFLLPVGNVESLANALVSLARDHRLRQSMSAAGRHRVEDFFSIDKMVQNYCHLYHTLYTKHLQRTQRSSGVPLCQQSNRDTGHVE